MDDDRKTQKICPNVTDPLNSPRWNGVLSAEQISNIKARQIPVGFDPVQIGWIATQRRSDAVLPCWRDPPAPLSWRGVESAPPLRFRPWRMSDAERYRGLLDDPAVWQFMPERWPGAVSLALARDLIAISAHEQHHEVRAVLQGGVPVGQVRLAFAKMGAERGQAEISYWLGRSHWGRGLGKRMVALATQKAFADQARLQRIIAYVHPDNPASAQILRSSGYREDVTRADGWLVFSTSRP